MDKKSIIGLVLIFLIFLGYMFWIKPSDEEIAARREQDSLMYVERMRADSLAQAEAEQKHLQDSLYQLAMTDTTLSDSTGAAQVAAMKVNLGQFGPNSDNQRLNVTVANKVMTTDLRSLGASVQKVVLEDFKTFGDGPLEIITPDANNMDLVFVDSRNDVINTKMIPFATFVDGSRLVGDSFVKVPEGDSLTVSFRAYVRPADTLAVDEDAYLEFRYVFYDDSYEVDFDINFHNIKDYVSVTPNLTLNWRNTLNRQEQYDRSQKGRNANRNKDSERFYTTLFYKNSGDNPSSLKDGRDDEKQVTTPIDWVAYKQQFFCAILMAEDGFRNAQQLQVSTDQGNKNDNYLCDMSSSLGVDYDAMADNYAVDMRMYFGPNKYRLLKDLDRSFERILPLGWGFFLTQWVSRFAIIPVFNFLEGFGWNYGIIIIILTLLLKIVITPLTWNSYKTGAVMRHLKPELDAINKKFPKQEQAMQKQQAMSQLQRKAGINPMAGCLPLLLQLPILYAMFRFYPASIELRQQPFLWCDDLSSYDSILNLPFNIPLYGDHVSLFCLLMFAMQFLYTVYTMKQQQGQASMPGMKFMMYFMPFMMLFIFNSQSAALNIYYFFNLLLSMATMFLIRAIMTEDKVRARMAKAEAAGKGKPQKKSKFQQRLEEMQRMSEEMQKQQQRRK
ncbi:MAG: membrane protein insertase YidC [Bacteroidales bacterium]|nr:membrane protein insertase YidC [Bacteroidales bacterium]